MNALTLGHIADLVHGTLIGNAGALVNRVAEIEHAAAGDITFLANVKYEKFLVRTEATCVLLSHSQPVGRPDQQVIRVDDPYAAFMTVQRVFAPAPQSVVIGIHSTAVVSPSATIAATASIGAYCVLGENVAVGEGSVLHPQVVLGDSVTVGDACVIHSHVTIDFGCRVGNRVTIHAGTVIGADGFGFTENASGTYDKISQNGIVVIDDDVEIGANCAIDRAAIGETRIGRGCKIDDLVMIAHNVSVGEDSLIVAQAGVAGSVKLGRHVVLAGQAGIGGHLELGDNIIISAQSGVSKSLAKPGLYRGSPARENHVALRAEALQRQLPELMQEVRNLTARVKELEARLGTDTNS